MTLLPRFQVTTFAMRAFRVAKHSTAATHLVLAKEG